MASTLSDGGGGGDVSHLPNSPLRKPTIPSGEARDPDPIFLVCSFQAQAGRARAGRPAAGRRKASKPQDINISLRGKDHPDLDGGMNGRSGRIRTCDPRVPNAVLYQTEPHSDLEAAL